MSKIMDIVNRKDGVASEQLEEIAAIVTTARENYGNVKDTIEIPEVNTTEGLRKLTYLSDADKVAKAGQAFSKLANAAVEAHSDTPGMVLDKEVESLIATDPILVNITASTGSSYL